MIIYNKHHRFFKNIKVSLHADLGFGAGDDREEDRFGFLYRDGQAENLFLGKRINQIKRIFAGIDLVKGVFSVFVGGRGIRVGAVMNEIGEKEKIDIINWSDNASEYIREALSPAEVIKVEIDDKKAKVHVSDDQQSIAIGKQGQNVRLASKLTGYEIDIVLQKSAPKKKKQNVEDALLSAIEETTEEESPKE